MCAYSPTECHDLILLMYFLKKISQDSLWCSEAREVEERREQLRQADTRFLSRLVRKQTPDRQEDPAEFLLNIARLRICLSSAAQQLEKAAIHGVSCYFSPIVHSLK